MPVLDDSAGERQTEEDGPSIGQAEVSVDTSDIQSTSTQVRLTEDCKLVTGLTDELLSNSSSLEEAIYQVSNQIMMPSGYRFLF